MSKIAIVYSKRLADMQRASDSGGYKYSSYNDALKVFEGALDDLGIGHMRWPENELDRTDLLMQENIKVILVPEMRVCLDRTLTELRRRAEEGWIVFATRDSFYYRPKGENETERVVLERFRDLFQLTGSNVTSRNRRLERGEIKFNHTRFSWITSEVPQRHKYSGDGAWFLAVVGESPVFFPYGEIVADRPKIWDETTDKELTGRRLPAFMIREYPNGGMFLYACFRLPLITNFRQVLENIWNYESRLAIEHKQDTIRNRELARLKMTVILLTAIVFLLLARELIGDTWIAYIGGIVFGTILGVLGNKATHALDGWLSR